MSTLDFACVGAHNLQVQPCFALAPRQSGSETPALTALLDQLRLLRVLLVRERCPAVEVEDVVQEAVARYLRAHVRYEGAAELRRLLAGIALNVLREHRRAATRRTAHFARYAITRHTEDAGERDESERRAEVRDAVDRLAALPRRAVLLVYWRGLSLSDAAAVSGCSRAVFRRRLAEARRQLAGVLATSAGRPERGRRAASHSSRIFSRTATAPGSFTSSGNT